MGNISREQLDKLVETLKTVEEIRQNAGVISAKADLTGGNPTIQISANMAKELFKGKTARVNRRSNYTHYELTLDGVDICWCDEYDMQEEVTI